VLLSYLFLVIPSREFPVCNLIRSRFIIASLIIFLTITAFLSVVGLFFLISAGYAMFSSFGGALIRAGLIPIPDGLPAIVNPLAEFTPAARDRMAGGKLLD
jgi:hypothetical protein